VKIFCSGIGGIGLSAYASLQKKDGHDVCGTDRAKSALVDDLASQGIAVSTDQSGAQIPADTDLVVYSEAIPETAPERRKARELGIRQISYPHALGELSTGKKVIAVCGTHGKSSTTGIATRLLLECGKDPTIVIGTKTPELGGKNWHKGSSDIFLLEACEYRRSFLFYEPSIILLTNCDGDHYDYYKDKKDYRHAFSEFVSKLPDDGILLAHLSDSDARIIATERGKTLIDADAFPLITLRTPGLHMRKNAQLVLALAQVLGIDAKKAESIVSGYSGSWRRLEVKATIAKNITVIDDYAHHPVEIRASLAALREAYPSRRIVCVFQPHTHDRTIKIYADFLSSFTDADLLLLCDVYEARKDIETHTVDLDDFAKRIAQASKVQTSVSGSLIDTKEILPKLLQENDVVVFMGAGDITSIASEMASGQ
jgi:UDP-N-acetylmuramate--alanine ligase